MNRDIIAYYDQLAPSYDEDRFANSYGRFVDARERAVLADWLRGRGEVLEIACGTGRLSNFAQVACDPSQQSLSVARSRHPDLTLVGADAARLPFAAERFDAVFGFHLLMHLDLSNVAAVIAEASRVLRRDGILIVDVLSALRRRMHARREVAQAWHGSTALSAAQFRSACCANRLRPLRMTGLLFLPVQRMPHWLRPYLTGLDRVACDAMPSLSSSLIGCFVKQ